MDFTIEILKLSQFFSRKNRATFTPEVNLLVPAMCSIRISALQCFRLRQALFPRWVRSWVFCVAVVSFVLLTIVMMVLFLLWVYVLCVVSQFLDVPELVVFEGLWS